MSGIASALQMWSCHNAVTHHHPRKQGLPLSSPLCKRGNWGAQKWNRLQAAQCVRWNPGPNLQTLLALRLGAQPASGLRFALPYGGNLPLRQVQGVSIICTHKRLKQTHLIFAPLHHFSEARSRPPSCEKGPKVEEMEGEGGGKRRKRHSPWGGSDNRQTGRR